MEKTVLSCDRSWISLVVHTICVHQLPKVWHLTHAFSACKYRHFYVTMSIGEPAKPYFLDIDTGSALTWLECDAPRQSKHTVHPHPKPMTYLLPYT
jgi:hypothetical protein